MGLGDQGNGAISVCTLGVSDGKPTETVSSKIESLLAKKQGSQSEWNWCSGARTNGAYLQQFQFQLIFKTAYKFPIPIGIHGLIQII